MTLSAAACQPTSATHGEPTVTTLASFRDLPTPRVTESANAQTPAPCLRNRVSRSRRGPIPDTAGPVSGGQARLHSFRPGRRDRLRGRAILVRPRSGNECGRLRQNTNLSPNWTRRCVRWNRFSLPALVIRPLAGDAMLATGLLK